MIKRIRSALCAVANTQDAKDMLRFFKTGPGEYAEGDIFLGICVPQLRIFAKQFQMATLSDLSLLLHSEFHEERMLALLILVAQYKRSKQARLQYDLFTFYCDNRTGVNNWDLVDVSARDIVGSYLLNKPRDLLYQWAQDATLWTRRISIVATHAFIREQQFGDTFTIVTLLMNDSHDLLHKAAGWMLREVGKKNRECEENFLLTCYRSMPRTMLRYAIEHFEEERRWAYLHGVL